MNQDYRHTQIGYLYLITYGVIIPFMGYLYLVTDYSLVLLIALLILFFALSTFASLTVELNDWKVSLRFGIGFVRKVFLLKDIEAFQAVRNPWYYGWGIRYTPRGWLFRVSGNMALELQLKSGKTVRIGTDDTEGLAAAIAHALNNLPVN